MQACLRETGALEVPHELLYGHAFCQPNEYYATNTPIRDQCDSIANPALTNCLCSCIVFNWCTSMTERLNNFQSITSCR